MGWSLLEVVRHKSPSVEEFRGFIGVVEGFFEGLTVFGSRDSYFKDGQEKRDQKAVHCRRKGDIL